MDVQSTESCNIRRALKRKKIKGPTSNSLKQLLSAPVADAALVLSLLPSLMSHVGSNDV